MHDSVVVFILALSFVLVLSPHLSRLLHLPTAPIEIIIGSLLAFWGVVDVKDENFTLIAEVGFLYLMFLAGLEVNLKAILKMPRNYITKSFYFLFILWFFAGILGSLFHLHPILIVVLPLISIGLLATLSKEYGKDVKWIEIAFLIGTIGEVFSIVALTISEASTSVGFDEDLFYKVLFLIAFLGGVFTLYIMFRLLFWWYPEFKSTLMPSDDGKYQDLRLAMGLFFIMIAIMRQLHLELAFGAFIAGLFISTFFHHKKVLEEKISSFGFGFLVPIFFIHVGASFDLNHIFLSDVLQTTAILLGLMLTIRLISAYILFSIMSQREAFLTALALFMPLTLMIAVATVGLEKHMIGIFDYYAVILASLIEVIVSMLTIKLLAKG